MIFLSGISWMTGEIRQFAVVLCSVVTQMHVFIGLSVLALLLKSCIFLMVLSYKKNHFL